MKTITSTPNAKKGMLSAILAGIAGNRFISNIALVQGASPSTAAGLSNNH